MSPLLALVLLGTPPAPAPASVVAVQGESRDGGAAWLVECPNCPTGGGGGASTSVWVLDAGVLNINAPPSLPLPAGASTEATLALIKAKTDNLDVALSTRTKPADSQTVSGTVAATQSGTWTVQPGNTANTTAWKVDNSAVTQPISAGSLPLPTGAATSALQPALVSGRVPVDPSGVTSPVSGTVTANAGSGTFTVNGTVTANAGTGTLAVSAASLPLPSGASTAAKQPALGTAGTASADVLSVQGVASMTALKVDGSGVTQPVSGTVTANAGTGTMAVSAASLPLPSGASTEATLAKLPLAQGSSTSSQAGPLVQGAVTTAAPSYTTGQTDPLSLTTAGAMRVDGSGVTQPVSGTFWQATQPVSGTVTSNAGTNLNTSALALDATLTGRTQKAQVTDGTRDGTVKAASTAAAATDTALVVAVSPNNSVAITAASLPLPSGAATSALQTTGNSSLSSIDGKTATLVSGRVPVDGSGVTQPVSGTFWQATQPVSGTVTANAGTGTMAVSLAVAPSTPVTGTFFQATQPVSIASMPSTPVTGTFFQTTQAVSGVDGGAIATDAQAALIAAELVNGSALVKVSNFPPTPLRNLAGAARVDGSGAIQPVSATALPLPSGAAQETGNLAAIVAQLAALTNGQQTGSVTFTQQPLNPFLLRCNPVRRTNCQP